MEDSCGGFSGGGRKEVSETEDFQEEEVWGMIKERESSNSNSKTRKNKLERGPSSSSTSSSSAWRVNAATRSVPRATTNISATEGVVPHYSSAPVDIPDWSKIFKKRSKKNLWDDACDAHNDDYGKVNDIETDDEDGDEMGPPHEYLARRLGSTQIASHSMCEGVGRTLKGRDLSKLRNAILNKTGFIE